MTIKLHITNYVLLNGKSTTLCGIVIPGDRPCVVFTKEECTVSPQNIPEFQQYEKHHCPICWDKEYIGLMLLKYIA